jgi:peptide/nickel transport system substrate-binding protein
MGRPHQFISGMLVTCLLVSSLLSACAGSTTQVRQYGGLVVAGLFEEPESLLVGQSNAPASSLVMNAIWAPLIYTDNMGRLRPGLLRELPTRANGGYAADFLTLRLRLRPHLQWSDGSPLTAQDVVYTISLLKDPAYGQKTGFASDEIQSATALDDSTVVLRLTTGDAALLALSLTDALAFSPLPQRVYGGMAPGDIPRSPQAFLPRITSGPFMLTERVPGDHVAVSRNPRYY